LDVQDLVLGFLAYSAVDFMRKKQKAQCLFKLNSEVRWHHSHCALLIKVNQSHPDPSRRQGVEKAHCSWRSAEVTPKKLTQGAYSSVVECVLSMGEFLGLILDITKKKKVTPDGRCCCDHVPCFECVPQRSHVRKLIPNATMLGDGA
jgi:hypothetical protein